MSVTQQTAKRLPTIKAGLLTGLNYDQIGKSTGVTRRTIERDVASWVDSGQFETWIKQEWVRLHNIIIHEDLTEAYRQVSRIMGRMVTRKIESHHIEEIKQINLVWKIEEKHEPNLTSEIPAPQRPKPIPQKHRPFSRT